MEGRAEDLGRRVVVEAGQSGLTAEVESEAGANTTGAPSSLLEVGPAGPHRRVTRQVVARREHFDASEAGVDDKHHVIYGDRGLGDVRREDNLPIGGGAGRRREATRSW